MAVLSAYELADIRVETDESLPDSCVVLKAGAPVATSKGGSTVAYTPLAGGPFRCAIAPGGLTSGERVVAGRPVALSDWTVTLRALLNVTVRDRLEVTIKETGELLRLEVSEVAGPRSDEFARKVGCTLGFRNA